MPKPKANTCSGQSIICADISTLPNIFIAKLLSVFYMFGYCWIKLYGLDFKHTKRNFFIIVSLTFFLR